MGGDFRVAKSVIRLVEVVGWAAVAIGLVVAALAFYTRDFMAPITLGAAVSGVGLVQIAIVQIARAQIVSAENSGEAVRLLGIMAKSQEAASVAVSAPQTVPRMRPDAHGVAVGSVGDSKLKAHQRDEIGTVVKRFMGRSIVREPKGFSVEGEGAFASVADAEKWISDNS